MAAEQGAGGGLAGAVKFDLVRLHETWMEFVFPRQRGAADTVLGKWRPTDTREVVLYRAWSTIGVPIVALLYPFVLLGYFVRFQTRRVSITATRLGLIGVIGLFALLWGGLSAAAFEFSGGLSAGGVVAVLAASVVAVAAAALSYGFWTLDGRVPTVLFAYPFAMTAIFLPPVVAGLYSTAVADVVFTSSDSLARWLLDSGPSVFGLKEFLVREFDRDGFAYVLMWFGIAVPTGWLLGAVVGLADLVRPTRE
ncbi:MAG: hypothetical protein ABEH56_05020 [Salinirussus sp.]